MSSTPDPAALIAFYREVAAMTVRHAVIDDHAVVFCDKLGAALEKVDPEWWKQFAPTDGSEQL